MLKTFIADLRANCERLINTAKALAVVSALSCDGFFYGVIHLKDWAFIPTCTPYYFSKSTKKEKNHENFCTHAC